MVTTHHQAILRDISRTDRTEVCGASLNNRPGSASGSLSSGSVSPPLSNVSAAVYLFALAQAVQRTKAEPLQQYTYAKAFYSA